MSSNKVRKSVSLNRNDSNDLKIIQKIEQPNFNFNAWAREAMIEKIRREERVVQTNGGGLKIILK